MPLALLLLASAAGAQLYTDAARGFKFKPPKDYAAVALTPGEFIVVAKYQDKSTDSGSAGNYNRTFEVSFFPKGKSGAEALEGAAAPSTPGLTGTKKEKDKPKAKAKSPEGDDDSMETFVRWLIDLRFGYCEIDKEKDITLPSGSARELTLTSTKNPLKVYLVILEQPDGHFVFEGSALSDRYDKAVLDFSKAAQSFTRIEKKDTSSHDVELSKMSEQDRFLQKQIDKLPPGWNHLRTKRYLFLYDADKAFVKQMTDQLEAMRDVYETMYKRDKPFDDVSIVRVCKNEDEYHAYGGPPGTGGYWISSQRELVFFDQYPRDETLCVLNHEAFHQYIYYFYGELSPHSWYNEGHGDYFSGAKLTKTYRITEFGAAPGGYNRSQLIKDMARLARQGKRVSEGAAAPLKDFLNYSQKQYYDRGPERPVGFYPEGWAIVHMLRESKSLQPKWQRILPDYLEALLAARQEVAEELMKKHLADAEKAKKGSSADLSRDVKDYFGKVDEDVVQKRAYTKTFKDWTDDDWKKFDDFFLNYIEKL